MCDVALKAIPKKMVKGNKESVWSEMQVLQGLDHPNVVRSFPSHLLHPCSPCHAPIVIVA
jgi:hypothetical protein